MNELIQAAAELRAVCQSQQREFCFIGVALQRWSEPRETIRQQLHSLAEVKEAPEIRDQLEVRRVEFER